MDSPADQTREVERFAWWPVLLTGEPWYRARSWVHLRRYRTVEQFEPDYGGVSTGHWLRLAAMALAESPAGADDRGVLTDGLRAADD